MPEMDDFTFFAASIREVLRERLLYGKEYKPLGRTPDVKLLRLAQAAIWTAGKLAPALAPKPGGSANATRRNSHVSRVGESVAS